MHTQTPDCAAVPRLQKSRSAWLHRRPTSVPPLGLFRVRVSESSPWAWEEAPKPRPYSPAQLGFQTPLIIKPVSLLLSGDADCFHTSVSVTSSSHGPWPSSTARLLPLHRRKEFRRTAAARQGQRVMPVPAAPAAPGLGGTRPGPGITTALCVPSSDSGRYTAPF